MTTLVRRLYYECAGCGIASHVPSDGEGTLAFYCTVCQDVTDRELSVERAVALPDHAVGEDDEVVG